MSKDVIYIKAFSVPSHEKKNKGMLTDTKFFVSVITPLFSKRLF